VGISGPRSNLYRNLDAGKRARYPLKPSGRTKLLLKSVEAPGLRSKIFLNLIPHVSIAGVRCTLLLVVLLLDVRDVENLGISIRFVSQSYPRNVHHLCVDFSPLVKFFYFPDSSSNRQVKDRASSIVITVLEGNPTSRVYLGSSWRCTARPIDSSQFIMCFPNPNEVNRALFWGKKKIR
jgi:hypothetical protein